MIENMKEDFVSAEDKQYNEEDWGKSRNNKKYNNRKKNNRYKNDNQDFRRKRSEPYKRSRKSYKSYEEEDGDY